MVEEMLVAVVVVALVVVVAFAMAAVVRSRLPYFKS